MSANTTDRATRIAQAAMLALSAALVFAMYHFWGNTTEVQHYTRSAFRWMTRLWSAARIYGGSSNWAGWLAPMAALAIIWIRRREIASAPKTTFWPGFGLLVLALLLHWAGARAQQTRLSLLALILMLWSVPLFLYGPRVGRLTLLPAAMLIYCVPLNFLDVFTFPLRQMASGMAMIVLNGLGVPARQLGSAIVSDPPGDFSIEGGDAASGLGLYLVVSALALLAGPALRMSGRRVALLFALSVPVVVFANAIRLIGVTAWADLFGGPVATAFNNRYSFALVLLLSLALLGGMVRVLRADLRGMIRAWKSESSYPTPPS